MLNKKRNFVYKFMILNKFKWLDFYNSDTFGRETFEKFTENLKRIILYNLFIYIQARRLS